MFDNYTLRARYYPVVILFFPIIILGVFYSMQFETYFHLLGSVGVAGALTYLFSQLGRDAGKQKEATLWKNWGGTPSIQALRWANPIIDTHTKKRYHEKLLHLCPVSTVPTLDLEHSSQNITDSIYQAWTKYLIAQTRDKQKFPLLFKENTSYGFRRNLWGLRSLGILITACLITVNYLYWALELQTTNIMLFPKSFLYSTTTLFVMLLFWLFIVNRKWVRLVAFAYAERLLESVDQI